MNRLTDERVAEMKRIFENGPVAWAFPANVCAEFEAALDELRDLRARVEALEAENARLRGAQGDVDAYLKYAADMAAVDEDNDA